MIVQQGLEALKEHWPQVLLATLGLYTLFSLVSSYLRPRVVDVNTGKPLPIVGSTTTYRWFFPKLRSRIKSFNNAVEWVAEGYEKYSKNGKAFMFHGLDGDMVVLPHTLIPEMKNLPVKVADIRSIDVSLPRASYTFSAIGAFAYNLCLFNRTLGSSILSTSISPRTSSMST